MKTFVSLRVIYGSKLNEIKTGRMEVSTIQIAIDYKVKQKYFDGFNYFVSEYPQAMSKEN